MIMLLTGTIILDTLVMFLPDGSVTKGKAADMEGAKKYHGGMTSAVSTLDGIGYLEKRRQK